MIDTIEGEVKDKAAAGVAFGVDFSAAAGQSIFSKSYLNEEKKG